MASTGFTDFSNYPTGLPPTDWTRDAGVGVFDVVEDVGSEGGKHWEQKANTPGLTRYTWDLSDDGENDQEIFALVRVFDSASGTDKVRLAVRDDGVGNGVFVQIATTAGNVGDVRAFFGISSIGSVGSIIFAFGQTVALRFRVTGTNVKLKAWVPPAAEPASFQLDTGFAIPDKPGPMGLTSDFFDRWELDVFGFGTGGLAAPITGTLSGEVEVAASMQVAFVGETQEAASMQVFLPGAKRINASICVLAVDSEVDQFSPGVHFDGLNPRFYRGSSFQRRDS